MLKKINKSKILDFIAFYKMSQPFGVCCTMQVVTKPQLSTV